MFARRVSVSLTSAALLAVAPLNAVFAQQTTHPVPVQTTTVASQCCRVKVYPVADLVVPLARTVEVCPDAAAKSPAKTTEEHLLKLVMGTVCPHTWSAVGGSGTVDYFPQTMSLVVNQTADVHEQIEGLLNSLRRLQDVQVALEVRLVDVPESFFERIGIDFDLNLKTDGDKGQKVEVTTTRTPAVKLDQIGTSFLNDKQVFQLLEAVQGDQLVRTCIMQAPKMTLSNGQQATLSVCDQQNYVTDVSMQKNGTNVTCVPKSESKKTGLGLTVQPVVSPDRRHVQVYFKMDQTQLASGQVPLFPVPMVVTPTFEGGFQGKPVVFTQYIQQPSFTTQSVEKTVAIPDGGTVVIGGLKKTIETRHEHGPPVLSKVPYVNRLFKNVSFGRECQSILVLVTLRVIVNKGECPKGSSACTPQDATMCQGYLAVMQLSPNSRFAEMAGQMLKKAGSEESQAECCEKTCCPPIAPRAAKAITELVKAYEAACAEGRADEAEKLARAALILDPTCFSKSRR